MVFSEETQFVCPVSWIKIPKNCLRVNIFTDNLIRTVYGEAKPRGQYGGETLAKISPLSVTAWYKSLLGLEKHQIYSVAI